ncbi:MAG: hypothetical protein ACRD82_03460 [Blastocatellia bacterium]
MSTTITLPLDTELAGLLARKAATQGVNVEQFALEAIRLVAERPANGSSEELQPDRAIASASKPVPQVRRSTHGRVDLSKEREWVRQHRDEYRGQWVVLDGDRLVGHAATAAEATVFVEQARAEGVRSPYIKLIPLDDEPIWMMWS